ncbi:MAG TPA: hypothetical protein VD886_19885 [Herpetosiphonaceae bacterium]|nr:hypothetical protein [Herpetosiphonaceae bacterium]
MATLRALGRSGLILGLALALAGCFTQQTATTLRPDGSGSQEVRIGVSQQLIDLAGMSGQSGTDIEDSLADMQTLADDLPSEWQATSAPWQSEDKQYTGASITMQFSDLAMLEEQLSAGAFAESQNSLMSFSDVEVRQEGGQYVIRATIEGSSEMEGLDAESAQMLDMLGGGSMGSAAPTLVWRIEMPGEITAWSEPELAAQEAEHKNVVTYTFPFPPAEAYVIEVRGNARAGVPSQVLLIVGALLGVGLLTIGLGLWLNRRNRRAAATQRVPAVPASATGPLAGPPIYPPAGPNAYPPAQQPYQPYAPPAQQPQQPPYAPPSPYAPPGPPAGPSQANLGPTRPLGGTSEFDSPRPPTRTLGSWMDERKDDR